MNRSYFRCLAFIVPTLIIHWQVLLLGHLLLKWVCYTGWTKVGLTSGVVAHKLSRGIGQTWKLEAKMGQRMLVDTPPQNCIQRIRSNWTIEWMEIVLPHPRSFPYSASLWGPINAKQFDKCLWKGFSIFLSLRRYIFINRCWKDLRLI